MAHDRVIAPVGGFLADILSGLGGTPKTLPSKYLYDEEGSRLFEAICDLREYYPTRMEAALLNDLAPELAKLIPDHSTLIEFGSGASVKTRILLDAATQIVGYAPIDISAEALASAAEMIREAYPRLDVTPILGDFTGMIELPTRADRRVLVGFFPGSTIGNFPPAEATAFLSGARHMLGDDALFIVGFDLVKDEATLVAAYDDASGVTAQFNKNMLRRLNRELGADFSLERFEHEARWNEADGRMEMHLRSLGDQVVTIADHSFRFYDGETIHTENSYKFTQSSFTVLAERAGWRVVRSWRSADPAVAVFLLHNSKEQRSYRPSN